MTRLQFLPQCVRGSNCCSATAAQPTRCSSHGGEASTTRRGINLATQRGERGQGVLLKSNTIRRQNPADPIFSPDSGLAQGCRGRRSTKWRAEVQPGGAAAKTPPTLASGTPQHFNTSPSGILRPRAYFAFGHHLTSRAYFAFGHHLTSPHPQRLP